MSKLSLVALRMKLHKKKHSNLLNSWTQDNMYFRFHVFTNAVDFTEISDLFPRKYLYNNNNYCIAIIPFVSTLRNLTKLMVYNSSYIFSFNV